MINSQVKSKTINTIGTVSFLLLVLLGCGGDVDGNTASTDNQSPNSEIINSQLMTEFNFEVSGVSSGHLKLEEYKTPIEYGISVPEIPTSKTVPLVLALHFSGGQGLPFLEGFALFGLADLDAIIISPTVPKGSDWSSAETTAMLQELVTLAV